MGSEARRYVTLLKEGPDDQFTAVMNGWDVAGQRARLNGPEDCLWFAHPSHQGKIGNARIERGGVVGTTRDWKVASALGEMWGQ